MNKQEQPWFLEERAFAFVSLALTKHHDVNVKPYAGRDMNIDLLVEILEHGKSTLRFFGAQLIPYLDLPKVKDADDRVFGHLGRDPFEAGLPLCAFVIGVRKPEGIYRWVVEPVVDGGRALLTPDAETEWRSLDDTGVARLIRDVNGWYNAHNGTMPKSGSTR